MPWLLLLSIILAVSALGAWLARGGGAAQRRVPAVVAGALAVLFFVWSCLSIVSTRNVGIVISFGKPVGTMENGVHLKWPWQKVPELDGTIQTDSQIGGFEGGKCTGGTPIRLANNSTACADNTIRWRINPDAGDSLFRDYKTNAAIKDSLVTRELNATLNEVFASYNPLAPDSAAGPNLAEVSDTATKRLQSKIGTQIEVQNVIISIIHYDNQTQDKINAYQARVADARIAEESQKVAIAEAEANRILSASVNNDPNVLVSKCLDMINAGKQLPAGFQCWPNTGVPLTVPAR